MSDLVVMLMLAAGQDEPQRRFLGPESVLGGTTAELKQKLSLSDEQSRRLDEVFEKAKSGLETITREGRWREMREFRDAARNAVREVLNEEQKKKYEELGRSGLMNQGGFGFGEISIDELKRQLNLGDEQVEQINRIREDSRLRMTKLWETIRETGDWQKTREEMERFRGESVERTKAVLSAEQKAKYDQLFAQAGTGRGRSSSQIAQQITRDLNVDPDKSQTIVNALSKVLDARRAVAEQLEPVNRQIRELIRGNATDEAVVRKLQELRQKREELEKVLHAVQGDLVELLSKSQEARLVADGILR